MPDWKRLVHQHLARLRLPPEREMEIAEELSQHLRCVYDEALADGLTPEAAEARALREIADWSALEGELSRAELTLEYRVLERPVEVTSRLGKGGIVMEAILQDLRYALRMLIKRPGFALTATLILSLGIGANATIFSLVNSFLFRPLPVREPERLVKLFANDHDVEIPHGMSYPDYLDYRQEQAIFSDLSASMTAPLSLNSGGQTTRAWALLVTGNYFSLLGVNALHGRVITAEDDRRGAPPVAVLGYRVWQRRFGGDPTVVGKTIKLNSEPFTIVGVAPEKMTSVNWVAHEVFIAAQIFGEESLADRGNHSFDLLGRLRPGVTLAGAREAVRLTAARLETAYPKTNRDVKVSVEPEIKARFGGAGSKYLEPIAAFGLTLAALALAVACANVANLMLARAATRQREFALRAAFGASRWRLVRLLLTESLLLAALSGVAGVLAAAWVTGWLSSRTPDMEFDLKLDFRLDWRALVFSFSVALVVGVLTGLTQAWQASRPDLNNALKGGGFGLSDPGRRWFRGSLAVTQVAASALLLVCAGLLLRSADAARKFNPGFRTSNLLLVSLDRQGSSREIEGFCERLLEGARALPGVRAAALASMAPFGPTGLSRLYLDGNQEREAASAISNTVSPDYFRLMEIPVVRGRDFTERDGESAPRVAIVNQALAEDLWPGQEPLGKRVRLERNGEPLEVVGVARNHKYLTLGEEPRPGFFLPLAQHDNPAITLHLLTDIEPATLAASAQRLVRELDEDVAVYRIRTMTEQLQRNYVVGPIVAGSRLVSILGLVALSLTAVGLYGLIAQWVTQRTREIGVRMALGARTGAVLRLAIVQGMRLTLIGVALGLLASVGLAQALKSLLYGVSASDPLIYGAVALLLLAVGVAACFIPARRAAKVDPMVALRFE